MALSKRVGTLDPKSFIWLAQGLGLG